MRYLLIFPLLCFVFCKQHKHTDLAVVAALPAKKEAHKCPPGQTYYESQESSGMFLVGGCWVDSIYRRQLKVFLKELCEGESGMGVVDKNTFYSEVGEYTDSGGCKFTETWRKRVGKKWVNITKKEYEHINKSVTHIHITKINKHLEDTAELGAGGSAWMDIENFKWPVKDSLNNFHSKTPEYFKGHRLHKFSEWIELTDPPYYSCIYCDKEIQADLLVPKPYLDIKRIWFVFPVGDTCYRNGYREFCDSLTSIHQNIDSVLLRYWNVMDTTCLSTKPQK